MQTKELEWVYSTCGREGYNGIYYTAKKDEVVYSVGRLGVVHNISQRKQRFFLEHTDTIISLVVDRSKRVAVTAQDGNEGRICIWSLDHITTLRSIFLQGIFTGMAFSFDATLVALMNSNILYLWDVQANKVVGIPLKHVADIKTIDIKFNPHETKWNELVTCGGRCIMFWTVGSDCHMLKVQEGKSTVEVLCAAFSENDQDILYCGTSDGSVQVWRQFRLLKSFSNLHSGPIDVIHVTQSGFATGSHDRKVKLWGERFRHYQDINLDTEKHSSKVNGHYIQSVCWQNDKVLVGTKEHGLFEVETYPKQTHFRVQGFMSGEVRALAAHPSESTFACGGDDKAIRLWDISTFSVSCQTESRISQVSTLDFSPDGAHLAASMDGSLQVFDTKKLFPIFLRRKTTLIYCKYFPDGQYLAAISTNKIDTYSVKESYVGAGKCEEPFKTYLLHYLQMTRNATDLRCLQMAKEKCVVVKDRLISLDADGRAILQWQIKSETKGVQGAEEQKQSWGFWDYIWSSVQKSVSDPAKEEELECSQGVLQDEEKRIERKMKELQQEEVKIQQKQEGLHRQEEELQRKYVCKEREHMSFKSSVLKAHDVSRSVKTTTKQYTHLFHTNVKEMVRDLPEEHRLKACSLLCKIFQETYDHVSGKVSSVLREKMCAMFSVRATWSETASAICKEQALKEAYEQVSGEVKAKLKEKLDVLFTVRTSQRVVVREHTLKHMCHAYSMLLQACGYSPDCTPTQKELEALYCHIDKQLQDESGLINDRMKNWIQKWLNKWIQKCWQLAWNLVVSVPPMIATCPSDLNPEIQDLVGDHVRLTRNSELVYYKPVLYENCLGDLAEKGIVAIEPTNPKTVEQSSLKGGAYPTSKSTHTSEPPVIGAQHREKDYDITAEKVLTEVDKLDFYELGIHLGIEKKILLKMCKGRTWDESYMPVMIQHWLSMGHATWKSLAEALSKSGEGDAAERIKIQYCSDSEYH